MRDRLRLWLSISLAALLLGAGLTSAEEPAEEASGVETRGSTVFANGRGVLHKGGGGAVLGFPDVCWTPAPPARVPVPYPNLGRSVSELEPGRHKLKGGGELVVKKASHKTSKGDEPGSTMAVAFGKQKATAEFVSYSMDVKVGATSQHRMGDPLLQNQKNTVAPRGTAKKHSRIVQLADGTWCGVCMRKQKITAIYKLRAPAE